MHRTGNIHCENRCQKVTNPLQGVDTTDANGLKHVSPIVLKWIFLLLPVKSNGERSDSGNYRPVSLLPIASKMFQYFVNGKLFKPLEGTDHFSDH